MKDWYWLIGATIGMTIAGFIAQRWQKKNDEECKKLVDESTNELMRSAFPEAFNNSQNEDEES